jgi:capsular polysaccharide transport system ATP-binding protein
MIIAQDLHKRYRTPTGMGKWVLKGLTFTIPPKTNVGIIGGNGAGKSTLLRILGGVDQPSKGTVERHCRMSWPMGYGGGLQGSLTGRQNARFVCRLHGHEDDIKDRVAFIEDFAEIGDAFDEPVRNYSSGMKSRLNFAMSLAFDFEVYISDEVTAAGDARMRQKAADAFKDLANRSGLLMAAHSESTLKQFCQSGIFLKDGLAHWFDDIDDALKAYKDSIKR